VADFVGHEPCPACGSKDNLARYSDGSAYCFGCSHTSVISSNSQSFMSTKTPADKSLLIGKPASFPDRGIDFETCKKYRYGVSFETGEHIADYCDSSGRTVAQKVRGPNKSFRWTGDPKKAGLYGQHLWGGGGRRLVITEGEIDALSVAQAQRLRWPVVSLPNGAQGAVRDLEKQIEFLESFDEVVLCFDNDEAGQKAAQDVAQKLRITPGKLRIATLPMKDANEMLVARKSKELVEALWGASLYRPDGIINGDQLWELVSAPLERGLGYPWECMNELTYGQRLRELVVWTAGTGIGKSQFIREVAYDLVQRHKQKVGILSLEESTREAALGQMSLHAGAKLHIPEERDKLTPEALRESFDATIGTGEYEFYDHFGSVTAEEILPKMRYMAVACGCKWLILDHVSIMVSGTAAQGDERKNIDELMTKLRCLAEELNIGLHVVSHVRKASEGAFEEGKPISLTDLRGSGSIAQIANMVIAIERNQQANGPARNRSKLRLLKNRFAGTTGPMGAVQYTPEGRLIETPMVALANAVAAEDSSGEEF